MKKVLLTGSTFTLLSQLQIARLSQLCVSNFKIKLTQRCIIVKLKSRDSYQVIVN